MAIKKLSAQGVDFLMQEEGLKLTPYLDSKGKPTIGVGNTYYPGGRKVKITDPPITKEKAIEMFNIIVARYEKTVADKVKSDIKQNQFDALVSLCYNIGSDGFAGSTVLELLNINPNDPKINEAFCLWKWSGGKPILLGRRQREVKLYFGSM